MAEKKESKTYSFLQKKIKSSHVCIVTLNWNKWELTINSLKSVLKSKDVNYSIILVDNGSVDDSVYRLKKFLLSINKKKPKSYKRSKFKYEFANHVCSGIIERIGDHTFIACDENYGFAGGCNVGIHYGLSFKKNSGIFLFNNDAVMNKSTLKTFVNISNETGASIVGARVIQKKRKKPFLGSNWPICLLKRNHMPDSVMENEYWQADIVEGSAMFIKEKLLKYRHKVNRYYLNPDLFLYWEDADFCLFSKKNNYVTVVSRDAFVLHDPGSSSGSQVSEISSYYFNRNLILMEKYWVSQPGKIFFIVYGIIKWNFLCFFWLFKGNTNMWAVIKASWMGSYDGFNGKTGKWDCHPDRVS